MRYQYNDRISKKANASLQRRYVSLQRKKIILAIIGVFLISTIILLSSTFKAFASAPESDVLLHKYYTSVYVEAGDTVWTLADRYIEGTGLNKQEYVNEICELNSLHDGKITSGQYIIMAGYTIEP